LNAPSTKPVMIVYSRESSTVVLFLPYYDFFLLGFTRNVFNEATLRKKIKSIDSDDGLQRKVLERTLA